MTKPSLTTKDINSFRGKLKTQNKKFVSLYPGESPNRQPVHTVYGGAQIFSSDVASKLSEGALKNLKKFAPNAKDLCKALGENYGDGKLWNTVYSRVEDKLKKEAVEDFRIDFEDGYGNRPDAEEDGHAISCAKEVAKGMKEKTLPPFIGIRIKPFNEERIQRSIRTMDLFLSTLIKETNKKLPDNFVVTLPKVQIKEQAEAFEKALSVLEKKLKLKNKTFKCELMIETPQAIIGFDGRSPMRSFVDAMKGRCTGVHFGTYDYTAGCNITAAYQAMSNPVCDFAKHVMQVSLAGTPIFLSDGATNIMPVGDIDTVHRAWKISYDHIRYSLKTGYYQGWDLHPAQLPIRYAAVFHFFLESFDQASSRLSSFIDKAARATLLGDVFDDAATGQGLLNYFLRGHSSGAMTTEEVLKTGLTMEEFRSRSFLKILENRKKV
jgi:citrate lyase beta subunit